jgi:hypothetical protein
MVGQAIPDADLLLTAQASISDSRSSERLRVGTRPSSRPRFARHDARAVVSVQVRPNHPGDDAQLARPVPQHTDRTLDALNALPPWVSVHLRFAATFPLGWGVLARRRARVSAPPEMWRAPRPTARPRFAFAATPPAGWWCALGFPAHSRGAPPSRRTVRHPELVALPLRRS